MSLFHLEFHLSFDQKSHFSRLLQHQQQQHCFHHVFDGAVAVLHSTVAIRSLDRNLSLDDILGSAVVVVDLDVVAVVVGNLVGPLMK